MRQFDFNKAVNEYLNPSNYTMAALGGDSSVGFVYKTMGLAFNMEQSDSPRKEHAQDFFKYRPGETVKGISPYDKKEHIGIIKYIYNSDKTGKPELVYIMDLDINHVLPITIESIQKAKKKDS